MTRRRRCRPLAQARRHYDALWPGVDLYAYARPGGLKYEFHVAPGADPSQVKLRYAGHDAPLRLDASGRLVVATAAGDLTDAAPLVYQADDATLARAVAAGPAFDPAADPSVTPVAARYALLDDDTYAVALDGGYDPTRSLVLDPELAFASYFGGSGDKEGVGGDEGLGIATDGAGGAWITGYTGAFDLPTPNGFDTTHNGGGFGRYDAFLARVTFGGELAFASYFGGSDNDYGRGIAPDGAGGAWVTGNTRSSDLPTPGGFDAVHNDGSQEAAGNDDAFVAHVTVDGTLAFATYYGGDSIDVGNGIASDGAGGAWVTGLTSSAALSTPGGFDTTLNNSSVQGNTRDAFVVHVTTIGTLAFASYFGGGGTDVGTGVAADDVGGVWITGYTSSVDLPTPGGFDKTSSGGFRDAFIAHVTMGGTLAFASYFGGDRGGDAGSGIAPDGAGGAWVTGSTYSDDLPTPGGFDTTFNGGDAFVARVTSGGMLTFASYIGGSDFDAGNGIAPNGSGGVWLTGITRSSDLRTPGGFDITYKSTYGTFLAAVSAGGALTFASYLGDGSGNGIAPDQAGGAWVTGNTGSAGLQTPGGFDTTSDGLDAFVAHITVTPDGPVRPDLVVDAVTFAASAVASGQPVAVSVTLRNLGAAAAPASEARLRLSADRTLTAGDLLLAPRVAVPAIGPGESRTVTYAATVPAGTPAGAYYVGAFADWNNAAGQSDVTNDAGLSATTLAVTAPAGTVRPTITLQPSGLTLSAGDAGSLTVAATGTGKLDYTWFHNDKPLGGKTGATLKFSAADPLQAGTYYAAVSNAAGVAQTTPVSVDVGVLAARQQPRQARLLVLGNDGSTAASGAFDASRPTVVITHGWQPVPVEGFIDFDRSTPGWVRSMASKVHARVNANVLAFVWPDAFNVDPWEASAATTAAGDELAFQLVQKLKVNYAPTLQFIGHSYGTIVGAEAVRHLETIRSGINVEQFTVLDAPIVSTYLPSGPFPNYAPTYFYNRLPDAGAYKVAWVDNYYGGNVTSFPPAVGRPIAGAAFNGGLFLPERNHEGVHNWYEETAEFADGAATTKPNLHQGFEWSAVLNGGLDPARPTPLGWKRPDVVARVAEALPPLPTSGGVLGWTVFAGKVTGGLLNLAGQAVQTLRLGGPTAGALRADSVSESAAGSGPVDSVTGLDVTIPSTATSLDFDFNFATPGDGDWMTVSFNATPLATYTGADVADGGFRSVSVPVGPLAGESGVLSVTLHAAGSTGTADATLEVANFRFIDEAPPAVAASAFAWQASQSVTLTFSEDVAPESLVAGDLLVTPVYAGGETVPNDPAAVAVTSVGYDAETRTATYVLPAPLADGNWRATLAGGSVRDEASNPLAGPASVDFFALAGDADRDRRVTLADFRRVASNLGKSGVGFAGGDFDYSGRVDAADLNRLMANLGRYLPVPAAAVDAAGLRGQVVTPRVSPAGPTRAATPVRAAGLVEARPTPSVAERSGLTTAFSSVPIRAVVG